MGDHPPQMPPLREMVRDGLRLRPLVQFDEALYCVVYTDLDLMRQVAEVLTMPAAQRAFALALKANADPHSRARYWVIEALDADVGLLGIVATPFGAVLPGYLWRFRPSGQYDAIKASAKNLRT